MKSSLHIETEFRSKSISSEAARSIYQLDFSTAFRQLNSLDNILICKRDSLSATTRRRRAPVALLHGLVRGHLPVD